MVFIVSCSNDDDNASEANTVIGAWVLVDSNNIPGFQVDSCTGQSTIVFLENNTANSVFYSENEAEACLASESSGSWSKDGSSYTILIPRIGSFPGGDVTGTVSFQGSQRFTFTIENTTSSLVFEAQ